MQISLKYLDNKPVVINMPIKVFGDSVGVIAGGKLVIKKRALKVKGFAKDLPEFLPIDISKLKIHEGKKVGDLSFDKLELLDSKKSMVLTIATSRVAQKTDAEIAEETAAAAAPESSCSRINILLTTIRLDEISDSWSGKYWRRV